MAIDETALIITLLVIFIAIIAGPLLRYLRKPKPIGPVESYLDDFSTRLDNAGNFRDDHQARR